jgi:hypothetical protein
MFKVLFQYVTTKPSVADEKPNKEPRERETLYRALERDEELVLPEWVPLVKTQYAYRWQFLKEIQCRKQTQGLGMSYMCKCTSMYCT